MSRTWKLAVGAFAALVAVNVALAFVQRLAGGTPGGPRSSSYATADHGLAAYAELLSRHGHDVARIREPAGTARLAPHATVVLLDAPAVSRRDTAALEAFVAAGGRLIAGGRSPSWIGDLFADPPTWSTARARAGGARARVPELRDVTRLAWAGEGSWTDTGDGRPAYGTLFAVADAAPGRILMLADASPLQNRLLAQRDNAAFALALAGARRDVVFLESYHGYGEASGVRAIPPRWWAAIALAACAGVVFMFARGRRLGPPEAEQRTLAPSRREYVESLAGILARTKQPDAALEPLRSRVAFATVRTDEDVLAAGHALAEQERRT
jgi:hypothetical protein